MTVIRCSADAQCKGGLGTKLTDAKFCHNAGLIDTIDPIIRRSLLLDDIGARTE
jgi:hypothetical protein